MKRAGALALLSFVFFARPSHGYEGASQSSSVARPRHLVCSAEREVYAPAPKSAPKSDALTPLPRIPRPEALTVVPQIVDDVVVVDPIPSRVVPPSPQRTPAVVVLHESRNGYRCIGLPRGTAGILRVLEAPPGARFYGQPFLESWIRENMIAAAVFDVQESLTPVRARFDHAFAGKPAPKTIGDHDAMERVSMKTQAADTLARLSDRAYAPKIRAWVVELERLWLGSSWRDTLAALRALSPEEASLYAIDALERIGRGDPNTQALEVPMLVAALTETHRARAFAAFDVPTLANKVGSPPCALLATRIRLGDPERKTAFRPLLASSLTDTIASACYNELMPFVFPGREASEAPVLVFRQRWHAMMTLASRLREKNDAASARAKRILVDGILHVASWDQLADPASTLVRGEDRAAAALVLALAGETRAKALIEKILTDEDEDLFDGPTALATYALDAHYPISERVLARRFARNASHHGTHIAASKYGAHRGVIEQTERGALVATLAAQKDARFSLGLLDAQSSAREEAMWHLARQKPRAACELVVRAARTASPESVQDAFWALSVLGDACRDAMDATARDATAPDYVRGMALEHLAMLRAASVPALAKQLDSASGVDRVSVERAAMISRSLE